MLTFNRVREAANTYVVDIPDIESAVACPFVLNGSGSRPYNDILNRSGAGRISAERFAEVAHTVSGLLLAQADGVECVGAEDVRTAMIDGSLEDDSLNYTGVDCAGFVFGVLRQSIGEKLDHLITVESDAVHRVLGMYNIADDLYGMSGDRMTLYDFTKLHEEQGGVYDPLRNVSVSRMKQSTLPVSVNSTKDLRPGDIGVYEPGVDGWGHTMVVTGVKGNRIKARHSGRVDPLSDIGGVSGFSLPVERLAEDHQGHRGALTIRRFAAIATDDSLDLGNAA